MQGIKLICVGKLREDWQKDACAEYVKRIGRFFPVSIVECRDQPDSDPRALQTEGERILKAVSPGCFLGALAIGGREMDSVGFSGFLSGLITDGREIALAIGGSCGLSEDVYKRSDARISFSKMTFPHGLMRVILLEQVYRALTIQAGHPYHK